MSVKLNINNGNLSPDMNAAVLPDSQKTTHGPSKPIQKSKKTATNHQHESKKRYFFVADAMGISTLTAARIVEGQLAHATINFDYSVMFEPCRKCFL